LVIGDPRVEAPFPPLPGAAIEARKVAAVLEASGQIEVHELVDASAGEVVKAWFGDRWQILHFAGHGVAEHTVGQSDEKDVERPGVAPRKISGLVLDSGRFLTAAEVQQMRAVPDLVFLNAAHMGVISGVRGDAASGASLATEFATLGCPAVIAPGWTIDDAAAVTFAEALYRALLSGEDFGRSVVSARRATHDAHPGVNTWAAYQCYGDPNFVLSARRTEPART
jgi:CHAT domain-containing protein